MVKKKSRRNIVDEGNFYVNVIPRRFIPLSITIAVMALVNAVLYGLNPEPPGWYMVFQYIINVAFAPILFVLYLFVLSLFLAGKHTASFKVIISGVIINYVTIILAFAWLYMAISINNVKSFSDPVGWIDGLSISVGIATTIGFSNSPVSVGAQLAVIAQEIVSFVITVILIGWIMSRVTSVARSMD